MWLILWKFVYFDGWFYYIYRIKLTVLFYNKLISLVFMIGILILKYPDGFYWKNVSIN